MGLNITWTDGCTVFLDIRGQECVGGIEFIDNREWTRQINFCQFHQQQVNILLLLNETL